MAAPRTQSVRAVVPAFYRHLLTTVEPTMTLLGIGGTILDPTPYIQALAGPNAPIVPQLHFLYTQLSGAWLALAFNGAVLLRGSDDLNVWRLYCAGMLLSDLVYAHSCAQAMGGWAVWVQFANWRALDWVVFLTSAPLGVVRALFLLNVGFGSGTGSGQKSARARK